MSADARRGHARAGQPARRPDGPGGPHPRPGPRDRSDVPRGDLRPQRRRARDRARRPDVGAPGVEVDGGRATGCSASRYCAPGLAQSWFDACSAYGAPLLVAKASWVGAWTFWLVAGCSARPRPRRPRALLGLTTARPPHRWPPGATRCRGAAVGWLIALVAVLNGIAWSLLIPPLQSFDEPVHVYYGAVPGRDLQRPAPDPGLRALRGGVAIVNAVRLFDVVGNRDGAAAVDAARGPRARPRARLRASAASARAPTAASASTRRSTTGSARSPTCSTPERQPARPAARDAARVRAARRGDRAVRVPVRARAAAGAAVGVDGGGRSSPRSSRCSASCRASSTPTWAWRRRAR